MPNPNKVPDFLGIAADLKKNASRYAATESVKFFVDSFRKEGWTDSSFTAWAKSNSPMAANKTLFKSGDLMRSIHKVEESPERVVIEANKPYAEIHNSGGTITVTPKMKKFFWAKYIELSGKVKKTKSGKASQSKSNLNTNAKAEFFKRLALMKVGSKIKIPKRQYMGESIIMMQQFDGWFLGRVEYKFAEATKQA